MTHIFEERALAIYRVYTMSAHSGVMKAIANFHRHDSDTTFELQQSCIPINYDELAVLSLKKHLFSFLGLRELAMKYRRKFLPTVVENIYVHIRSRACPVTEISVFATVIR